MLAKYIMRAIPAAVSDFALGTTMIFYKNSVIMLASAHLHSAHIDQVELLLETAILSHVIDSVIVIQRSAVPLLGCSSDLTLAGDSDDMSWKVS